MKVWQYQSKIISEPWITIKKKPTEAEFKDYLKYHYKLREHIIDYNPTLEDYEKP